MRSNHRMMQWVSQGNIFQDNRCIFFRFSLLKYFIDCQEIFCWLSNIFSWNWKYFTENYFSDFPDCSEIFCWLSKNIFMKMKIFHWQQSQDILQDNRCIFFRFSRLPRNILLIVFQNNIFLMFEKYFVDCRKIFSW